VPGRAGTIRCVEASLGERLRAGPLDVTPADNVAVVDGRALRLTPNELTLLITLARRPGAVIRRDALAREAWQRPLRSGDRSVDVYVRRLRRKLAEAAPGWVFLHTHFALGYRFAPERSQAFHIGAIEP